VAVNLTIARCAACPLRNNSRNSAHPMDIATIPSCSSATSALTVLGRDKKSNSRGFPKVTVQLPPRLILATACTSFRTVILQEPRT